MGSLVIYANQTLFWLLCAQKTLRDTFPPLVSRYVFSFRISMLTVTGGNLLFAQKRRIKAEIKEELAEEIENEGSLHM